MLCKELASEMIRYMEASIQKPIHLLGRWSFATWMRDNANMGETDALALFDKLAAPNSKHYKKEERGVMKVVVDGHTTIMNEQGVESIEVLRDAAPSTMRKEDFLKPSTQGLTSTTDLFLFSRN